ncbi:MAG: bifunctional glycosyltransferase family 2/GtrA family protein [Oscillospiraceae bacterium]|nr:bifunctional glycosyltransferase family 2/GtrA family protein [Oscillospiraceae bacterium]
MEQQTKRATDVAVALPSLNPDGRILEVVDGLVGLGFREIVIVNDGSTGDSLRYFDRLRGYPQCVVLDHPENQGKGAALRTAFAYLAAHEDARRPGVVTADGDGQHLPGDILACCQAMVERDQIILGCRNFSEAGVPARSIFGNRVTSFVFRTGCGIRLSDTQTGLRVIPTRYLPFLLRVRGDRFEYETNMLLEMKRASIGFQEVRIETVYEETGHTSHFRTFTDSFLVYRVILKFLCSSGIASLIDEGVFYLALVLSQRLWHSYSIPLCTVAARAISSFVNYNANKKAVFRCGNHYGHTLARYYALCVPQMLVSAGCVWLLSHLLTSGAPWRVTLLKICVDIMLFLISFRIQRDWVFRQEPQMGPGSAGEPSAKDPR